MDGMVGSLSRIVHVGEPIIADLRMFGSIPTLLLQQFYRIPFLDYLAAFFLFSAFYGSNSFWVLIVEVSS